MGMVHGTVVCAALQWVARAFVGGPYFARKSHALEWNTLSAPV